MTRALFQFDNSLNTFAINFAIVLWGFVKIVFWYVSTNAIDLISLFECDTALT